MFIPNRLCVILLLLIFLLFCIGPTAFTQNVGIGEAVPRAKLAVRGNLAIGTTAFTQNATQPANGLSVEGFVGAGTVNPQERIHSTQNMRADGIVYWGNGLVRTETRADAGLQGDAGARSGFFETPAPAPATSWPTGATNWWHLVDVRHSNNSNNYAMQFSGSFFDQNLFVRKTNDNPAQPWSQVFTTSYHPGPHFVNYTSLTTTDNVSWTTVDLSALLPADARVAIISARARESNGDREAWVRPMGDGTKEYHLIRVRADGVGDNNGCVNQVVVPLDANRRFEYRAENFDGFEMFLVGYYR